MKRVILFLMLSCSAMMAQTIGLVAFEDRGGVINEETVADIESSVNETLSHYKNPHRLEVMTALPQDFTLRYKQERDSYLEEFAHEHSVDTVILIDYKRGARAVVVKAVRVTDSNAGKIASVSYDDEMASYLGDAISAEILKLLNQLGVLNHAKQYL